MTDTTKQVDPLLKWVVLEIDELAKLGAISEELRIAARRVAERESGSWNGMKCNDMVDLAIGLARAAP
jgi:hypothetical protein